MKKRLFAALLSVCLLFTLLPATAFAEGEADSGTPPVQSALCEHHTQHDESCGYTEGTAEIPCSHEHTEDCYTLVTECVHEHTTECYPAESVSENTATPSEPEEAEPTACTHVCSEESGCITKALDCKHEHDEDCGYVPATEGTPCTFVCEICNAQDSGDTATPSDAQPEECTCETPCTVEEINADCPVCSAEGAELDKVCVGIAPMLPVTVLAAGEIELYVGGQQITESGCYENQSGTWTKVDGTEPASGQFYYDTSTTTLTLNNVLIVGGEFNGTTLGAGICAITEDDQALSLTIDLMGTNTVSGSYGIYVSGEDNSDLIITGSGSLAAEGPGNGYGTGIEVSSSIGYANLTINEAEVSTANGSMRGIRFRSGTNHSNATLTVNGGKLTVSAKYGITYQIGSNGGDGIPGLTVTDNAVVDVQAGVFSIESTVAFQVGAGGASTGGIVFDDKAGTVYGNVTLKEDLTIGEGESLTIPEDSSLDMGGHTITVENGGKLDGTPTGNGTVIDKSSPVSYLDEKGTEQSCSDYEVVTANDTQWTDGWYVVNSDVTINRRVDVSGDVKLILTDGHTLTVNGGIHVTGDDRFTVYGQENGTGKLTATATNHVGAGIGGNGSTTTSAQDGENGGTIVIAGGIIEAVGGDRPEDTDSPCGGAGIGNGFRASNGGSVTIYGGEVNATGGVANAGIGGDGSTIQISGGTVEATSGGAGAAIGGTNGTAGTITITDSNVTANGEGGTGIGGGYEGHGGTITITNSTVTASGDQGAGIGGGSGIPGSAGGNGGNVTIVNSTVTASSKEGDSIGAGRNGADPGTLTLSPADSKAIAAKAGADEASALTLNGSPFTAKTAVTDLVRGTKYFRSEPCDIHTVTVNDSYAQTTGAGNYAEGATVAIDAGTRSGYTFDGWTSADGVTFANAGSAQTTFTMPDKSVTVTANWKKNSGGGGGGTSRPTPSLSDQAIDDIRDARPGDTVEITLRPGRTTLEREVFEELAGQDITLEIGAGDGVLWTVNGLDIPEDTRLHDLDLDVDLGDSGIPATVLNAVTGEIGTVQLSLAHDGEFGFTMTLSAPLGRDNADYWANLYWFNERTEELEFQQAARIAKDGTAEFDLDHASDYAIVIDDRSHEPVDLPFTDVPEGYWAYDAIQYVYGEGLMAGTSGSTFSPEGTTTRGQIVTILWRLSGSPVVNYLMDFDDVDPAAYYAEAIRWATSEGIAGGYGGGVFGPDDPITREQLAVMLHRYAQHEGYDVSIGEDTNILSYADAFDVSEYAASALQWACGAGIISGTGDGSTLTPQGEATRAQAAVILMRFCELDK